MSDRALSRRTTRFSHTWRQRVVQSSSPSKSSKCYKKQVLVILSFYQLWHAAVTSSQRMPVAPRTSQTCTQCLHYAKHLSKNLAWWTSHASKEEELSAQVGAVSQRPSLRALERKMSRWRSRWETWSQNCSDWQIELRWKTRKTRLKWRLTKHSWSRKMSKLSKLRLEWKLK